MLRCFFLSAWYNICISSFGVFVVKSLSVPLREDPLAPYAWKAAGQEASSNYDRVSPLFQSGVYNELPELSLIHI